MFIRGLMDKLMGATGDVIDGATAQRMVVEGAHLVDVRSVQEFAQGHIDGALNVPVDQVERRLAEVGSPSDVIVLYCRSGARSAAAAGLLRRRGYGQVYDLGPMSAWQS